MKTYTYIAFLRAINVGGRFVKMDRLRGLFEDLGLDNVRSYIQSGNIFFETPGKPTKASRAVLAKRIEAHLAKELGYEVPVFLRTVEELEATLALDPFRDVKVTPDIRLLILFTDTPLPKDATFSYESPKGDTKVLSATSGEIFVVADQSGDRPGNPAGWVERNFKVTVTGRFWGTAEKILKAAKETEATKGN